MKVVLLGATQGMGRALARRMAERGDALFLLGRDPDELEKSARDLECRSPRPTTVSHGELDLRSTDDFEPALARAAEVLGGFDAVVVTAGIYASQEQLEEDAGRLEELLTVNFTRTVQFCEVARKQLLRQGGGRLVVFSSVAGDRGRKPVALYGATKAGLSHYLESLDHRYREAGLATICVKPGFVKTGMTDGLRPPPFAGDPDDVARRVLIAIDDRRPVVYAPAAWWWVMAVVKRLPRFVMRRVGF